MKYEHEDGSWTCNGCDYQTDSSDDLRNHLKLTGHQPSVASMRMNNQILKCYTCKEEFEGYKMLMNHRKENHPSNKICKNIPSCPHGQACWYVHPSTDSTTNTNNESPSNTESPAEPKSIIMIY